MYKVYDPDGNKLIFKFLSDLRAYFELSKEDTHKAYMNGCAHVTAWGDTEIVVLHY